MVLYPRISILELKFTYLPPMRLPRVIRTLHRQIHSSAETGTINASEIAHFSRLSSQWWDEQGEFSFLHKMNPVRVQLIREKLLELSQDREGGKKVQTSQVLEGLDVLDVGCGGGLLSEVGHRDLVLLVLLSQVPNRALRAWAAVRWVSMPRSPISL